MYQKGAAKSRALNHALFCRDPFAERAEHECRDFAAGAGRAGRKLRCRFAGGNAVFNGPENRFVVKCVGIHIVEAAAHILGCRLAGIAPEEGDKLGARNGCVRREVRRVRALGYAVFNSPEDRVIAVCIGIGLRNIRKLLYAAARLGSACCAPEEGHDLCTCARCFGCKVAFILAVSYLRCVVVCPHNGTVEPVGSVYIIKRI